MKNDNWIVSYLLHLFVACIAMLVCVFVVSFILPNREQIDPLRGPYFWGPITFGVIAGILIGKNARPSVLLFLWLVPAVLLAWEVYGWWKYQYPGENLRQSLFDNFLGRNCSGSECLYEGFETAPLISAVVYGATALISKLLRLVITPQSTGTPAPTSNHA